MGGNIKLSATVISCMGKDSDKDDFYFNGNFSNCHNTESIQCSFEKYLNNSIFAISDSIGKDNGEFDGISAVREIKRYHERAKEQQFVLENITEKIYEAVQLSSNLIYSKSVIANQNSSILTGFSSLIIDNNKAAVMNLGNNGIFLYRNGEQKELFSRTGSRKNEKLKMLGISPTASDLYQDTEKILKLAEEESKTKIKLSSSFELEEGDILILCSDGLLNYISRGRFESIVDSGFDPSKMASVLFQEASKNNVSDSITVMVIRVEEIKNSTGYKKAYSVPFENESDDEDDEEESESGTNVVNIILSVVCVLVISGVLFMGYLIFKNSNILSPGNDSQSPATQSSMTTAGSSGLSQSTISTPDEETAGDSTATDPETEPGNDGGSQQGTSKPGNQNDNPGTGQSDSGEYDIHVVQSGETLSSISAKYYGDPNKYDLIIKYNNLKNENSLYVDQELKIPKIK